MCILVQVILTVTLRGRYRRHLYFTGEGTGHKEVEFARKWPSWHAHTKEGPGQLGRERESPPERGPAHRAGRCFQSCLPVRFPSVTHLLPSEGGAACGSGGHRFLQKLNYFLYVLLGKLKIPNKLLTAVIMNIYLNAFLFPNDPSHTRSFSKSGEVQESINTIKLPVRGRADVGCVNVISKTQNIPKKPPNIQPASQTVIKRKEKQLSSRQ